MTEYKEDGPVAKLALENSALQKRIAVLEDLLTSAYNISNRNGENTHWDRFSSQLFINGIRHVTAKTFKILPSDTIPTAEYEQLKAGYKKAIDEWDNLLEDLEINGLHHADYYINSKAKFKAIDQARGKE